MIVEPGEIEVTGDPVPDGRHGCMVIVGSMEFKDGKVIAFYPNYDYTLEAEKNGDQIAFKVFALPPKVVRCTLTGPFLGGPFALEPCVIMPDGSLAPWDGTPSTQMEQPLESFEGKCLVCGKRLSDDGVCYSSHGDSL